MSRFGGAEGDISLSWRSPLDAFAPLADRPHALLLLSGAPHTRSFIFAEPHDVFVGDSYAPLDAARAALSAPTASPCWAAGVLNYELGLELSGPRHPMIERDQPDVRFGLYPAVAQFDHQAQRLTLHGRREPCLQLASLLGDASASMKAHTGAARLAPATLPDEVEAMVARAVEYVRAGDIYQANISQRFDAYLPGGDDPYQVFLKLTAASPAPFAAFFRAGADRAVATHSPERFVQVDDNGLVVSQPIKGTRPRGRTDGEDANLAHSLRNSDKDRAENLMIVDLMRNDFARVCAPGSVAVSNLFALESYANVHHLVSTVRGRLEAGRDAFDLLRAAFPPGSITGAPKLRAMEIIAELEREARGPYCGAVGYVGANGEADFNVMIRSIDFAHDEKIWRASFRAGAGIVADSDPRAEHDEMLAKAASIITAFGAERAGE